MTSYKAIIIDDEPRGAQSLQKMLQHSHPDIAVEVLAYSGMEGIAAINEYQPHLIFLDIHMMDMSGFDMLEKLEIVNFDIIFTTAHDEYALKAFRYAAVDYLLKPIDMDELQEALNKFRSKQNQPSITTSYTHLETLFLQLKGKNLDRIALPTQQGLVFIKIDDIVRLQSNSNYTIFYIHNRKPIIVSKTMGEFEELLQDYCFFRIHHSHIINLNHIDKYIKGEGGSVVMSDGNEIDVSRRKKEDFLQKFEKNILGNK